MTGSPGSRSDTWLTATKLGSRLGRNIHSKWFCRLNQAVAATATTTSISAARAPAVRQRPPRDCAGARHSAAVSRRLTTRATAVNAGAICLIVCDTREAARALRGERLDEPHRQAHHRDRRTSHRGKNQPQARAHRERESGYPIGQRSARKRIAVTSMTGIVGVI